MHRILKVAYLAAALAMAGHAGAQVTLYERGGFEGRSFTTNADVENLNRAGFRGRSSSLSVKGDRSDRWEVCEKGRFRGRCVILRRGDYASLDSMGLNQRVSSVRAVQRHADEDEHYAPPPVAVLDDGRRPSERVYEAAITSVRAVLEDRGERCWIEREKVQPEGNGKNIPGAVIGALIGGVLGHQVGGGRGKDVATGVGAITGAVIGAHTGGTSDRPQGSTQDVRRCASSPDQARPAYWDVTYVFRGVEHQVQMTTPPGASVPVNERGEPRV